MSITVLDPGHLTPAEQYACARVDLLAPDQVTFVTQCAAVGGVLSVTDQGPGDTHLVSVGDGSSPPTEAIEHPLPSDPPPRLEDAFLLIYADALDDFERTRIATENRVRSLIQMKGMADSPEAVKMQATVDALGKLEHDVELSLCRAMRKHPLGPWCKAQRGIGEKQGARLLAAIGDPYIDHRTDTPRTVSQLWALCGYHVLPASQKPTDTQDPLAGGEPSVRTDHHSVGFPHRRIVGSDILGSHPDQRRDDAHPRIVGVAARRRKGQRANWSATAKMRAYLVAVSCMKSGGPYRDVYLTRRERTAVSHPDWPDGHSHNDALRVAAKAILRDLWRESRRLHETSA